MTMPNRMHGKPIPPEDGIVKICPHCRKRYIKAKLKREGGKIFRYCPKCGERVDK